MFQFSAVSYHEENKIRKTEVKQQCTVRCAIRKHRKFHFFQISKQETFKQSINKSLTAFSAPITTVQNVLFQHKILSNLQSLSKQMCEHRHNLKDSLSQGVK